MDTNKQSEQALRRRVQELEAELLDTMDKLVRTRTELHIIFMLNETSPLSNNKPLAMVRSMTQEEMIVSVLRQNHPQGMSLKAVQQDIERLFSREIPRQTLSSQLNRLKRRGFVLKGPFEGQWRWKDISYETKQQV